MCWTCGIEQCICDINHSKETELNPQSEQVTYNPGNRHDKPRKINFSENTGIANKSIGRPSEASGKIRPHRSTSQIKQRSRHAIRRNSRDSTEHDHVHDHRHCGLNHKPGRPEDRLFVLGNNVTFNKQRNQVAIAPKLLEINRKEFILRFNNNVPMFLLDGVLFLCHIL